jgi:hypothetical protein
MIKANEVRLGNWVLFNDNTDRYGKITLIRESGIIHLSCDYIPDGWEERAKGIVTDISDIQSIPLTPEILEKAGFVKYTHQTAWFIPLKADYFIEFIDGKIIFTCDDSFYNMDMLNIQYLHQLQNLYYAVTGEELNIYLYGGYPGQ